MHRKFHRLMISFLLIFLFASPALAEDGYNISNYDMLVEVQPDGSAEITETLIYQFDGEYNGILSQFDTDGIAGIDQMRIYIDGEEMTLADEMTYIDNTYTITENGDLFEIRVYSPGRGDTRAVTYEYTMLSLAVRYSDTGMIHRKFIGANNAVTLQNAVVTVNFPGNGDIRAFVHGAMDESDIAVLENSVLFGPENIYSGKWAEMRLLFPADWISEAPLKDEPMYEYALSEEARIAEEERLLAARTENAKYIFTAVYLLLFFALWALMAKKYGLKGRLHETPDPRRITRYPAAFITAVLEEEADTNALTGTLMELVADGHIRMEPEGEGLIFTLVRPDRDGLYPHQAALIDWLFDGRDFFLLSELNAGKDYERAQQFENGYNRYLNQVSRDMADAHLRFSNDGVRIAVNALIILLGAMGAGGILIAGTPNVFLGIVVGCMLFVLLFLTSRIRRLTDEGELLQMDASAFRDAGIPEGSALTDSIAYYAALGMTEPLIRTIETREDGTNENDMPVWMYTGWYYGLHKLNVSMRDAHYHNASIPNPNASSSSSSHSSGNGGGGGHGAW